MYKKNKKNPHVYSVHASFLTRFFFHFSLYIRNFPFLFIPCCHTPVNTCAVRVCKSGLTNCLISIYSGIPKKKIAPAMFQMSLGYERMLEKTTTIELSMRTTREQILRLS